MNNRIEKVFRDPVHGYISVNHLIILKLINTKEFQRLRRIKQLGVTAEVFHGAEHSRFEHSLGTYEIARKICNYFSIISTDKICKPFYFFFIDIVFSIFFI